jgi:hypothetical protein
VLFVVLRSDVDIVQQNVDRRTDVGVLIGFDPGKETKPTAPRVVRPSGGGTKQTVIVGAEVIQGGKTESVKFGADGTKKDR